MRNTDKKPILYRSAIVIGTICLTLVVSFGLFKQNNNLLKGDITSSDEEEVLGINSVDEITISPNDQTITVYETPQDIEVLNGSGSYTFSLEANDTGLVGIVVDNRFVFSQSAQATGIATLEITDQETETSQTAIIRVKTTTIMPQIINQTIEVGDTPSSVLISGGSGEYNFTVESIDSSISASDISAEIQDDKLVFTEPITEIGNITIRIFDVQDTTNYTFTSVSIAEEVVFNINEQNVFVDEDPQDIKVLLDSEKTDYSVSLKANGTGLAGGLNGSTFSFTSTATTEGTASLKAIDSDDSEVLGTSYINVISKAIVVNLSAQKIRIGEMPTDIYVQAGCGKYSFKLDDSDGTGLRGSPSTDNTAYFFTTAPTSAGEATLTITDYYDTTITTDIPIYIESSDLTLNMTGQTVSAGALPDNFIVSGGSGFYRFSLSDGGTGLKGTGNGNVFEFTSTATETGTATLEIIDEYDNSKTISADIVVSEAVLTNINIYTDCEEPIVGNTCLLNAFAVYSNGTEKNISNEVDWIGTDAIGTISDGYYLKITTEDTANIYATWDEAEDMVSNTISITTQRALPEIISIKTTGNASAAKGTYETLYIEVKNMNSIEQLQSVEITLIKNLYCSVDDIPSSAQVFDIVNYDATPVFSLTDDIAMLEIPIFIPEYSDLTDGKHTILVKVSSVAGVSSEIYPFNVGIPATGDINNDGNFSTLDAIMAMRFYAKSSTPTSLQLEAADFNDNGSVDLVDVVSVFRIVMANQNGENITYNACSE